MKRDFWEKLKDNLPIFITLTTGIIATIGSNLGWITDTAILSIIVGLLTLFATSEIIERRRRFSKLETMLEQNLETTINSLMGVHIELFETEDDFFDYLNKKLPTIKHTLRYASLGPGPSRVSSKAGDFYETRAKLIRKSKIRVNYLTMFTNRIRFERTREEICQLDGKSFYVGFFDFFPSAAPMLSFTVTDEDEVIIGGHRTLYSPSEGTNSILVKHKVLAKLFADYFDLLWRRSNKLNEKEINYELLEELDKGLKN